jgi:hypothetical protein
MDSSKWVSGASREVAQKKAEEKFAGKKFTLEQDEDVLDTWFSSGLWPWSIQGWPSEVSFPLSFSRRSRLTEEFGSRTRISKPSTLPPFSKRAGISSSSGSHGWSCSVSK